jgi:hypothetical protein
MAPEPQLRLPEPGSFEDLPRPIRIEVAFAETVIRPLSMSASGLPAATTRCLWRNSPSARSCTCERRKTLVLADLTFAAPKSLGLKLATALLTAQ